MSVLPFSLIPNNMTQEITQAINSDKSIIGQYGPQLNALRADQQGKWSYLNHKSKDVEQWKNKVLPMVKELLCMPETDFQPKVRILRKFTFDCLDMEELEWEMAYGRKTKAIFMKPQNATGQLPAILGLHDHGGNKYFGHRKIIKTSNEDHPLIEPHQNEYYEGIAWANAIAKRGYAVLVHDVFTFGSRRVMYQDISDISWGDCKITNHTDDQPENPEQIKIYNQWAGEHEHIMAKSLFSGGYTWPGVTLYEDQLALSILAARSEVDAERLGCAGLSGGGLRTTYLGGMDDRIKCAVCVGFMSTWRDFMENKSYTHTWMTYTPGLPNKLEFPEILSLRMPLPTMVLNSDQDQLFTLEEMKKAIDLLQSNFDKAGFGDRFQGHHFPGLHKFDKEMQAVAFDWMDKWLQ
ncbi:hypothetical protein GCM10025777_07440 [Membranihabitans marinus]